VGVRSYTGDGLIDKANLVGPIAFDAAQGTIDFNQAYIAKDSFRFNPFGVAFEQFFNNTTDSPRGDQSRIFGDAYSQLQPIF